MFFEISGGIVFIPRNLLFGLLIFSNSSFVEITLTGGLYTSIKKYTYYS